MGVVFEREICRALSDGKVTTEAASTYGVWGLLTCTRYFMCGDVRWKDLGCGDRAHVIPLLCWVSRPFHRLWPGFGSP